VNSGGVDGCETSVDCCVGFGAKPVSKGELVDGAAILSLAGAGGTPEGFVRDDSGTGACSSAFAA